MRRADQFSDAVRRGARSGAPRLVVHVGTRTGDDLRPTSNRVSDAVLVGFVVPRAVGNAVRTSLIAVVTVTLLVSLAIYGGDGNFNLSG